MNKLKNFFPKKKFGQNFLIENGIIHNIVQLINPKKNQVLVEIGPGLAALTKPICQLIDKLVVIEIDPILLNLLKYRSFYGKLIIFCQDAVTFNYFDLFNNKKLIRIFGNLPYNISTPLLICLFKKINIIQDMNFMLQKEVAERLVASPGNKLYCRLSIIAQYYCKIKKLLNISPKFFRPEPKVYSAFVNLTPYKNSPYFVYDINSLSDVTQSAFQKRRKILRHSLENLFSEEKLIKLDINPKLRAENISILQYCKLANDLYKRQSNF